MKIKDKLDFTDKPEPITFRANETVRNALDIMCEKDIGSIIVVNEDHTIAGIVTERDMMKRVLSKNVDLESTKLSDIMSTNIRAANENDDLLDWLKVMSNERFRHLPIVDQDKKLVNVLSQGDFVAFTYHDLYEKIKFDLKGRLGQNLQLLLIVSAVVTLGLIAFKL